MSSKKNFLRKIELPIQFNAISLSFLCKHVSNELNIQNVKNYGKDIRKWHICMNTANAADDDTIYRRFLTRMKERTERRRRKEKKRDRRKTIEHAATV